MTFLWIAVIVIALFVEIITTALVSVWFIAGAIGALVASLMGASNIIQYITFVMFSLITLIACRPIIMKNRKVSNDSLTVANIEVLVGKAAIVTEAIDNVRGTGRVVVSGDYWAARSEDGLNIEKDKSVTVVRVEGVKVVVKAVDEECDINVKLEN